MPKISRAPRVLTMCGSSRNGMAMPVAICSSSQAGMRSVERRASLSKPSETCPRSASTRMAVPGQDRRYRGAPSVNAINDLQIHERKGGVEEVRGREREQHEACHKPDALMCSASHQDMHVKPLRQRQVDENLRQSIVWRNWRKNESHLRRKSWIWAPHAWHQRLITRTTRTTWTRTHHCSSRDAVDLPIALTAIVGK